MQMFPETVPMYALDHALQRAKLAEARLAACELAIQIALEHHAREHVACAGDEPTCSGCQALKAVLP